MADSEILNKALAKRKQLARGLERLPAYQELVRLDAFIETYRELEGGGSSKLSVTRGIRASGSSGRARPSLPDIAATICAETDGPIPVGELLTLLEERGRPVGGKNPKINLSSVLSRDPRFENVTGRGWQLKNKNDDAPSAEIDEASDETGPPALTGGPDHGGTGPSSR